MATQTPLAETINDFWRMVLQHKSSTIVMLNQLREGYEVGEPALPDSLFYRLGIHTYSGSIRTVKVFITRGTGLWNRTVRSSP